MKAVRCTNETNPHWFDIDTHDRCPHCGAPAAQTRRSMKPAEKQTVQTDIPVVPVQDTPDISGIHGNEETIWVAPPHPQADNPPEIFGGESPDEPVFGEEDDKTLAWYDNNKDSVKSDADDDPTLSWFDESALESNGKEPMSAIEESGEKLPAEPAVNTEPEKEHSETLAEAIERSSSNEEGKTLSFFSLKTQEISGQTEAGTGKETRQASDPIVGWIVGIKGPHKFESFSLRAGKNFIGRNAANAIVLAKDATVSRDRHAIIVFEPVNKDFYFQAGEANGLIYLNGEYISLSAKLKKHDIIRLGNSELLFVPLCGDDFAWEDYL